MTRIAGITAEKLKINMMTGEMVECKRDVNEDKPSEVRLSLFHPSPMSCAHLSQP